MSAPTLPTTQPCPVCEQPVTLPRPDGAYGLESTVTAWCPACESEATWQIEPCMTYYVGELVAVNGQPAASEETLV